MTGPEKSSELPSDASHLNLPIESYPFTIEPHAVLVLGMHRSGTSALTRVVNLLGADLPKQLLKPSQENALGYWESSNLMALHDELLASAGSRWDDWACFNPAWYESLAAVDFRQRLAGFLSDEFPKTDLFIIKDPRICRFVPFWFEALRQFKAVPKVLIPVRNPLEVAASLEARNGFTPAKSYLLWLRHILDAERETRSIARSVLTYHSLLQNWHGVMDKVADDLGLQWPALSHQTQAEIAQFLSVRYRHHVTEDAALQVRPEVVTWVQETYEVLLAMARGENSGTGQQRLDEINRALNQADQAFGPLCAAQAVALNKQHKKSKDLGSALDAAQARLAQQVAKTEQLSSTVTTSKARIEQLSGTMVERDKHIQRLNQELTTTRHNLSESTQTLQNVSAELFNYKAQVEKLTRQLANRHDRLQQFTDNLQHVDKTLNQRTTDLAHQTAVTKQLSETLLLREKQLQQTTQALESTQKSLHAQEAQTNHLSCRCNQMTIENHQLQHLLGETVAARHELKVIKNSLAWRFSIPISWLSNLLWWPSRVLYWLFTLQLTQRFYQLRHINLIRASGLLDETFYLTHHPDVVESDMDPLWHFLTHGATEGRNPCSLFSTSYYLNTYPNVANSKLSPLAHYILFGAAQGYNPHPLFHTQHYLTENPEIAKSGINPLAHYLKEATKRGCNPNPLFDTAYYIAKNPDVLVSGVNPLIHFLTFKENQPHPLFDSVYYLNTNPDVEKSQINPLVHFLRQGGIQGRNPNPLFDSQYYLDTNPDIKKTGENPLVHFIKQGVKESRNPSPLFNTRYYLNQNPDVEKSGANPLKHFLEHGIREKRNPNPFFDLVYYLETNPDVASAGINPLMHFLNRGAFEGRKPNPNFDPTYYLKTNPDVAASGINPLVHYISHG
jgi:hypothetical protein